MANLTPAFIKAEIKINNSLRPLFLNDARLFLLKRAGQTKRFLVVAEVISGWYFEFDKQFRDEAAASIATLTDIKDLTAQSSFLAYGAAGLGEEIDVFSFEKKDVVKPDALSPSWKIYCRRAPEETFSIPVELPAAQIE